MVVGAAFAYGSGLYEFGSSARPGPGYFPLGLGLLLALLGLGVVLQSLRTNSTPDNGAPTDTEFVAPWAWKPLWLIIGSIALFGVTLPYLGLFVALPILVITTSAAVHDFRWIPVLTSAAILTLASYLIFVYGLSLSIPTWPAIFQR